MKKQVLEPNVQISSIGGAELTGDGFIGMDDLMVFGSQWLEGG